MSSRDKEATKARILAAAVTEFAEHGYAGAMVDVLEYHSFHHGGLAHPAGSDHMSVPTALRIGDMHFLRDTPSDAPPD